MATFESKRITSLDDFRKTTERKSEKVKIVGESEPFNAQFPTENIDAIQYSYDEGKSFGTPKVRMILIRKDGTRIDARVPANLDMDLILDGADKLDTTAIYGVVGVMASYSPSGKKKDKRTYADLTFYNKPKLPVKE